MSVANPAPPIIPALAPTSPPALTPFPFRTLPLEVRNLIYALLFDKAQHPTATNPQILSTCHQVNHEATRLLYSASATQVVVVHHDGVEVHNGPGLDEARADGEGTRLRGRECLKSLRRFEVVAVRIVVNDDARASEQRDSLVAAVRDLCAVLAENRYLRSLSVEVEMQTPGREGDQTRSLMGQAREEGERALLEPFRALGGVTHVRFSGAVEDWAFVAGLREGMMEGEEGGEFAGEEMDLAAWEDVEGSAM